MMNQMIRIKRYKVNDIHWNNLDTEFCEFLVFDLKYDQFTLLKEVHTIVVDYIIEMHTSLQTVSINFNWIIMFT